jgi:DNA-binding NtrC family response regulator
MNESFDQLVDRLVAGGFFLEEAVELLEKGMIERVLRRHDGNKSEASKALGIHRNTLQRKITQYGMDANHPRRKSATRANGRPAGGRARGRAAS